VTAPRPGAGRPSRPPDEVATERLPVVRPAPTDPPGWPAGHPLLGLVVLLGVAMIVVWLGSRLFTDEEPAPHVPAAGPVAAQPDAVVPVPATSAAPAPQVEDGVSAAGIAAALKAPHPRDNSRSCTDLKLGCVHLMTTDAVSVYEWPDEAAAKRWAAASQVEVDRAGRFVLQYAPDQQEVTDARTRARYLRKARDLVAG
jgi:hypothetical protein